MILSNIIGPLDISGEIAGILNKCRTAPSGKVPKEYEAARLSRAFPRLALKKKGLNLYGRR